MRVQSPIDIAFEAPGYKGKFGANGHHEVNGAGSPELPVLPFIVWQAALNTLGNEGWDLVAVNNVDEADIPQSTQLWIFKRP